MEEITAEGAAAIINAPLAIPFEMAQMAFPPLAELTQSELNSQYKRFLSGEDKMEAVETPYEFQFDVPFDKDEDLVLITHIENEDKESFEDFIKRASLILKPCRTSKEILERIEFLKSQDKEMLLSKIAESFLLEKLFFLSQTTEHKLIEDLEQHRIKQTQLDQCRCAVDVTPRGPISDVADQEINDLHSKLALISSAKFQYGDLAMLRSEDNYYMIRQAAVMLGRNTDKVNVDIDVSYNTDPHCPHISRNQAILSFQPDFNFYLENVGNRAFRVNGAIISPGFACILPFGALLDFSGSLFIFIPNVELIEKLKNV